MFCTRQTILHDVGQRLGPFGGIGPGAQMAWLLASHCVFKLLELGFAYLAPSLGERGEREHWLFRQWARMARRYILKNEQGNAMNQHIIYLDTCFVQLHKRICSVSSTVSGSCVHMFKRVMGSPPALHRSCHQANHKKPRHITTPISFAHRVPPGIPSLAPTWLNNPQATLVQPKLLNMLPVRAPEHEHERPDRTKKTLPSAFWPWLGRFGPHACDW